MNPKTLTLIKKIKLQTKYLSDGALLRAFRRSHANIEHLFRDQKMVAQVIFIEEVSSIFLSVRDSIEDTHQNDVYPFFVRAYSHWESATRLWASARIPETYCLLRASLETMSYAYVLRLESSPNLTLEEWLRRDEDEKAHRDKFTWGAISRGLPNDLAKHIRYLYHECISRGAHPNPDAVNCGSTIFPDDRNVVVYQGAQFNIMVLSSLSVIMTGILYLETFARLYPTSFTCKKATQRIEKITELFQKWIDTLQTNFQEGLATAEK